MAGENDQIQSGEGQTSEAGLSEAARNTELNTLLQQAQEAFDADSSKDFNVYADQAIKIDPENPVLWDLLAKFGGWDSKQYDFDTDYILRTIRHDLEKVPEEKRYEKASEIYAVRKRQIGLRLEAALMMPSYMGAKQVQQIMMDWKRLLAEMPNLTANLIQEEVMQVSNLCTRSKRATMPSDRLVYTAYATFNHKEPYGETFKAALASRAEKEQQRELKAMEESRKAAAKRLEEYQKQREAGELSVEDEKKILNSEIDELMLQIAKVEDLSDKKRYEQQLEDIKAHKATIKPYKFFKQKAADARIKELEDKIAEVDAPLQANIASLQAQIETFRDRLKELG